ncbi:MAG: hypothetical protein AABX80_00535 [Nanoarchaeota archaeon]
MITKKIYGKIEQKIDEYETIAKFYEINHNLGRFQNKVGLNRIFNEIKTDLTMSQGEKYFDKLSSLQNRIKKFI